MSQEECNRILIADDDTATRLIVRRRVESWGYTAIMAEDGTEALSILTGPNPPRIAILDWMMPGHDGIDICRILAEEDEKPFIYTILLTAKSEKEDLVIAFENGAHDFIRKPPDTDELRCRIDVGRRLVEAEDRALSYAKQMEDLARTDALTGIFNRRYFFELGEREVARIERFKHDSALIMLDLDHFKAVNDTHGHDIGDDTLKATTRSLTACLRNTDIFGRLGGEEFGILLTETSLTGAQETAERLRRTIEEMKVPLPDGSNLQITISLGLVPLKPGDTNLSENLKRADEALYEAKQTGRNRVCTATTP
jgi:diguanylate cyclase (GGDEF)-like protein